MQQVHIGNTVFAKMNMQNAKRLAEIYHAGPSRIELHTIQLPQDDSALHFLRGCGVPDEWIDFYRAQMIPNQDQDQLPSLAQRYQPE